MEANRCAAVTISINIIQHLREVIEPLRACSEWNDIDSWLQLEACLCWNRASMVNGITASQPPLPDLRTFQLHVLIPQQLTYQSTHPSQKPQTPPIWENSLTAHYHWTALGCLPDWSSYLFHHQKLRCPFLSPPLLAYAWHIDWFTTPLDPSAWISARMPWPETGEEPCEERTTRCEEWVHSTNSVCC